MATRFAATERRAFWAYYAISYAIDGAVLALLATALGAGAYAAFWFFLAPGALRLIGAATKLWGFGKRMGWFFMFERESRVLDTMVEFQREQFPAPDRYFNDVDDYLNEAAPSPVVPEASRIKAAITLGILAAQRTHGPRSEAMARMIVIEEALRRMPPRDGEGGA